MKSCFKVSDIRCTFLCIFFLLSLTILNSAKAQCPVADFALPDTVCIGENVKFENNSTGAVSYEWDFCDQELINTIPRFSRVVSSSVLATSTGMDLIQHLDHWYGFVTKEGSIIRLEFGSGLLNTPQIIELGDLNNLIDRPNAIKIVQVNNQWFGLVPDIRGSKLFLLTFAEGIKEQPLITPIASTLIVEPSDLEIVKKNDGTLIAFVTNGNDGQGSVVCLNFGNNLTNVPTETIIPISGSDKLRGISILEETCNSYTAFVTSFDNRRLFRLNFMNGINNSPAINTISNLTVSIDNPANLKYLKQQGKSYIFVQSRLGSLYKYRLDESKNTAGIANYGKIDNNAFGLTMVKDKSSWLGFSFEYTNGRLNLIDFLEDCSKISNSFATDTSPNNISYTSSGDFLVSLNLTNESGNTLDTFKTIHVRENVAPDLDFTFQTICFGTPSQFTLTSDQTLSSAAWFINGDTLAGESISYIFPAPGTYPVTLKVESADGCGQRVTKDITIYEPPEPKFGVDQAVICTNGEVAFQNLTDMKGADEIISYTWDFNGEGSSTEANPSFTFTTGGSKTVSLTASIPGCANTYDTTFTVEAGPVVSFNTPPQICQGQEITLENLTTGEEITGYSWSFGDGGTYASTALESPRYVYDSAGTYIVLLEVNNVNGCANTLSKTVTIYAQPQAAFTADAACAGAPTQFVDESTTGINSNVIAWNWDFGDGGTSEVRNPQYTYTMPGIYEASLMVLTSAGCTDTLVQEIVVESAVQADFSAQTLCPNLATPYSVQFSDQSSAANGEQISEWLWTINGENFVIANPTYTFEAPGTYQVSLTVFSETACNASVTKNITIEAPSTPDFSFALNCAGEPVSFTHHSLAEGIAISQYLWDFDGLGISYEENPDFIFEAAGSYEVSLTLETEQGCRYSISREVIVPEKPGAAFTADIAYGGTPLTVNFTNSSTAGVSYRWDFGGAGESSEENPSFTFTEAGTYTVSLQVEDTLGCTDTFSKEIKVVTPVTDLQLQRVSLLSEEGEPDIRLLLTIRNQGTLSMSNFNIAITLDQVLSLQQTFEGSIEPGETINYPLDFSVSAQRNQGIDLRYICATLEEKAEDINLSNNRSCASLDDIFSVITPYPNPSANIFKVDMVLPVQEAVQLSLLNVRGELLQNLRFDNTKVGLNRFTLDVSTMVPGNYILQVNYQNRKEIHRLMVNP